jgi:hypothetical protein
MTTKFRRFTDLSVSERMLFTIFLITIGLGYLFALAHTYYSHADRDGKPGLSVEDIKIAYYGKSDITRLGAGLNAGMADNLAFPGQKDIIFRWIENGSDEATFNEKIAPILNENCIACHSIESGMGLPPFTSYKKVLELTKMDTGVSIKTLVRVSHIHMFGIAFILFLVGRIFVLSEIPVTLKRVMVLVPFLAILLDILSWYLTKIIPNFAYVVILAGALMGISMAAQILISIYQMWFYTPHKRIEM